jgi:DNA-binding ferritin-like protein
MTLLKNRDVWEPWFKLLGFLAMLAAMDESIGRVLKHLKDLKLYDNTVIIFSSDVSFFCFLYLELKFFNWNLASFHLNMHSLRTEGIAHLELQTFHIAEKRTPFGKEAQRLLRSFTRKVRFKSFDTSMSEFFT